MVLEYFLIFLDLCLLIILPIGLIFPRLVFLGRNATRFKVAFVYGMGLFIVSVAFGIVHSQKPQSEADFIDAVEEIKAQGGWDNVSPDKRATLCKSLTPDKVSDWIGTVDATRNSYTHETNLLVIRIESDIYIKTKKSEDDVPESLNPDDFSHKPSVLLIPNPELKDEKIQPDTESSGMSPAEEQAFLERIKKNAQEKVDVTEIAVGTPLYKKIQNLEYKEVVRFSGSFVKPHSESCVGEGKTDWGGPNNSFIFKFSDITPVKYDLIR